VCARFAQNRAGSLLFHWFVNKGNFDNDGDDDDDVGDGNGDSNNDADNNQLVSGITMTTSTTTTTTTTKSMATGRGGQQHGTARHSGGGRGTAMATVAAAVR
jgi:hypothetical protein